MKNTNNKNQLKLLLLILTGLMVGCNQDQNNQQQSNLDTPDVATKATNKVAKIKPNQILSPLHDSSGQMIIGYNQSINSFAPIQCFTYDTTNGDVFSDSSLSIGYTATDIQKKLGIDSSVKIKLGTFSVSDKNDITKTSTYLSNAIRVYYTAYVGYQLSNQIRGLNDTGTALFKQGLQTFAAQCGSSYIAGFSGYYYTVFYFDISSSDVKTMDSIKNTAKGKVDFLTLMNTVNQSTSENSSNVTITAGVSNYGGSPEDAAQILAATSGILDNNLPACISSNGKNQTACSNFITKDVNSAIENISKMVEAEAKSNTSVYPDFSTVSNSVTQITGAMIAEKKTKNIPDPYVQYNLLNAANVAEDLSIAASNASALVSIVLKAGNLIPSLQFAVPQLSNNATSYTQAAEPIWQNIKNCLSNVTSCSTVGNPSVSGALANSAIALQALYNQAYQISFINTNNVKNGPGYIIPMILLNNNNNAYLFSPSSPNYQSGATGAPGVIEFYKTNNITSIDYQLSNDASIINGQVLIPSGVALSWWSVNPDNLYSSVPEPLGCSLLNLANNSCTAYILPVKNNGTSYYDYITMSVASPFTTVTKAQ